MKTNTFLSIGVTLLAFVNIVAQQNEGPVEIATPCLTPYNESGGCISIKQCPSVLEEIRKRIVTSLEFVRKSQCVPQDKLNSTDIFVCCKTRNVSSRSAVRLFPRRCGEQPESVAGRIVGGVKTGVNEFPWIALLKSSNEDVLSNACSGFLVSSVIVITAAHCVAYQRPGYMENITHVELGSYDISTETKPTTQTLEIGYTIVHPGYKFKDRSRQNDIAIVRLKTQAIFSDFVQPICLLRSDIIFNKTKEFTIAGWGRTDIFGEGSTTKIKAVVPYVSFEKCTRQFVEHANITLNKSTQFCAGGSRQDTCSGDSGGPIMLKYGNVWHAAGVVSFGVGCGTEGWPGVYTYIPHYVPWIEDVISRKLKFRARNSTYSLRMGGP